MNKAAKAKILHKSGKHRTRQSERKRRTAGTHQQQHKSGNPQSAKQPNCTAISALPAPARAYSAARQNMNAADTPAAPAMQRNALQTTEPQTAAVCADPQSFRRELLALLPNLRAFAVSLCGKSDHADDLLQDTIMRAWSKQESFTMGTNMKAWLFTILRNEFYSEIRRRGREIQDTDDFFANHVAVAPSQYGSLDLQDFKYALDKLPPDQKEAIILIGASGFSYEEAAEICRCAIGTIKSRVSRARTRLQDLLGIAGENGGSADSTSSPS